jgi:hypothetical protein
MYEKVTMKHILKTERKIFKREVERGGIRKSNIGDKYYKRILYA